MNTKKRTPLGDIGNKINQPGAQKENKEIGKRPERAGSLSPRLDDKNRSNPLHAVDLLKEIFEHLRKTEPRFKPSVTYMGRQTDINEKMRSVLIDWLVDVHLKFKLLPETLYLTVDLIDRFLDQKVVSRQKLQLVGVVAMLLGAKYEEIFPPEVKDFIYISANTYNRDEILRMERLMLTTLDFNLTVPTPYPFLKRGLQVADADKVVCLMAHYLAELCLLDYKMLVYLPSTIAAACIYMANKFLKKEPWSKTLEYYTHYKVQNIERCCCDILELVRNAPNQKFQAVRKKYSYSKFGEVSKLAIVDNLMEVP